MTRWTLLKITTLGAAQRKTEPKVRMVSCIALLFFLWPNALGRAATKQETPDKEMLKLMDFLQHWDMIKDLDLIRDFSQVEADAERATTASSGKGLPPRKREPTK